MSLNVLQAFIIIKMGPLWLWFDSTSWFHTLVSHLQIWSAGYWLANPKGSSPNYASLRKARKKLCFHAQNSPCLLHKNWYLSNFWASSLNGDLKNEPKLSWLWTCAVVRTQIEPEPPAVASTITQQPSETLKKRLLSKIFILLQDSSIALSEWIACSNFR